MAKRNYLSVLRENQYLLLSKISISGEVLDLGGDNNSDYHELLRGEYRITTANLRGVDANLSVDLENKLEIIDNSFDGVVCLNVLEHVFDSCNVVSETYRVLKPGGSLVLSTPFIFNVHGSPNDYFRFTDSALKKMLVLQGYEQINIKTIGLGLFSVLFQIIDGPEFVRSRFVRQSAKFVFVGMDIILGKLFGKYSRLAERIPVGYFVTAVKPYAK